VHLSARARALPLAITSLRSDWITVRSRPAKAAASNLNDYLQASLPYDNHVCSEARTLDRCRSSQAVAHRFAQRDGLTVRQRPRNHQSGVRASSKRPDRLLKSLPGAIR